MNEEQENNLEKINSTDQQMNNTNNNSQFEIISQYFSKAMPIIAAIPKILPFFIFIFSLKCLFISLPDPIEYHLDDIKSNEQVIERNKQIFCVKTLHFFLFLQMIVYYISALIVRHYSDKTELLLPKLWADPILHHLLFILVSLFFDVHCRIFYLQYTLIYLHESIRIFDIDLLSRTHDIQIKMHKYNKIILCSVYYQRLRAIVELLWMPYLIVWALYTFELESIFFLYFYFFVVFLYSVRYDQFHQWIWFQIDSYCTKFAYKSKDPSKQILLKILYFIRRFGSLAKRIYPDIE